MVMCDVPPEQYTLDPVPAYTPPPGDGLAGNLSLPSILCYRHLTCWIILFLSVQTINSKKIGTMSIFFCFVSSDTTQVCAYDAR